MFFYDIRFLFYFYLSTIHVLEIFVCTFSLMNIHQLGFCSYALFDMDGKQVPQELVQKVGVSFETILQEVSHFFH